MRVYCIKTKYNKNDRYGLEKSTDYVLFKRGHFYEYDNRYQYVISKDGLKFTFDSNHFAHEQDWREERLNQILNGED